MLSPFWLRAPSRLCGARNQCNAVTAEPSLEKATAVDERRRDERRRSRRDRQARVRRKGRRLIERQSLLVVSQMRGPRGAAQRGETDCICERSDFGKLCTCSVFAQENSLFLGGEV